MFTEKQTVKNIEVDIHLKEGAKLIQQKGGPASIHLQCAVEKKLDKLKKKGHIEKAKNLQKLFREPRSDHFKKDKSVQKALDYQKLNKITVQRKVQMPNMDELI